MNPRISCPIAFLFLFLSICTASGIASVGYTHSKTHPFYFLAYGRLFQIHPEEERLTLLHTFHPAAPTVGLDPDGLFWARSGEKELAAFNPETGKIEAAVTLPHRPYNHIITPDGKAYVTHHTLTSRGFWLSVVDTSKKKIKKTIKDIWGLRTGLAYGNGFVYLATIGVERPDNLYLYRIDTRNDRLEEIHRVPKTDYAWKISFFKNRLYICHINMPKRSSSPMIEVLDLKKKAITRVIKDSQLDGVKEIRGRITFAGDRGLFPCQTEDGGSGIAMFDPLSGRVAKVLKVCGHIYRIIGIREETLFYINSPAEAGKKGISLYFFSLTQGKEVRIISMAQFLKGQ